MLSGITLFLFLATAHAVSAPADTALRLVMVDGTILRGTLVGNDAQVLTLEVDGKAKEIAMDAVRKAFDVSTNTPYTFTTPVQTAPTPAVQNSGPGTVPNITAPETPADEQYPPVIQRRHRITQNRGPNVLDKAWYIYNGIGIASFKYPAEIQNLTDATLSGDSDVSHIPLSIEFLGFYYSFRPHRLLLGFILDGGADSYQSRRLSIFQINEYLMAVSSMYFLGQGVGRGIFLRADAGYARLVTDQDSLTLARNDGIGALLGVGYAFPIARKLSIMVTADDMWLNMQGQFYDSPRLNLGVMF